jgi:hypothetical protein
MPASQREYIVDLMVSTALVFACAGLLFWSQPSPDPDLPECGTPQAEMGYRCIRVLPPPPDPGPWRWN